MTEHMTDHLKTVFAERQIRIDTTQYDLLARMLGDVESVALWDDAPAVARSRTIVVDEPPRLLQVEAFCRTLPATAVVVIPFSENPAFDFLKSKLRGYGMIGAQAPHAPHQIWWGGPQPAAPAPDSRSILKSHIVSCVRRNSPEEETAIGFETALAALNMSSSIARDDFHIAYDHLPNSRSRLLLDAWDRTVKPLIWLDPHCVGNPSSIATDLGHTDFAVTLAPDGGFSTNFLYFGRSDASRDLLKTWKKLCEEFPELPANHLLDAAWSLVTSQRTLVTLWIAPHTGLAVARVAAADLVSASELELTQAALTTPALRSARRAGRSAAPEPQCVLNSRFGGRGPLTLIVLSEHATARETASTMESAVDAFWRFDGGFSAIGVVICQSEKESAETIEKIGDGYFLSVEAGVVLERDIFNALYQRTQDQQLNFVMQRNCARKRTGGGNEIEIARSQVTYLDSSTAKCAERSDELRRPMLKVV
jgi:hypothetical protein